jgi:hypothetical protein
MIRLRWSFIYLIIIISTDFSMASTDANVDKKVMDRFEFNWESMRYDKSVTQYNPKVSSNEQASSSNESLKLSCEIEIKDPNLVLGISRKGVLTEMTDSKRRNIEISQEPTAMRRPPIPTMRNIPMPRSMDMTYEGLSYHRIFTQPPTIPRWRALLYKYLRIPQAPFKPELVDELQPARVQFELDIGLLEPSGGKIRNLKGYFYALMAESLEHVEVPFEPNDQWVRLTDEVAIQVREADYTISGSSLRFNFEIEENRTGGERIHRLSVGDYLPEKIVMDRQLIGEDGKQINRSPGLGPLPAHVGGGGGGSHSGPGGVSPVEKIRFVIAVNPKHYTIPFELKDIPLPDPESKEEKE